MCRSDWLALAGLVALVLLAALGLLPGETVVTYLAGVLLKSPLNRGE